jgi:predicted DNA-binding ribbon-helix-helix protein
MKSSKPIKSAVVKRSIKIAGHPTSLSLEDEFWEALREIAKERGSTLGDLVRSINAKRQNANLSSAIRVFLLRHYRGRQRTPSA